MQHATTRTERQQWRNWAGNQQCAPLAVRQPVSEDELVGIVKAASAAGRRVKAVGAGHSFTGTALTDGELLQLDRYGRVLSADSSTGLVTVQAGIRLQRLNVELGDRGLAMPNLGDIAYQSVAGAIATSTHGTGAALGGLATQVRGLRLVTGDGSIVTCSPQHEPDVFHAARVGVGALGLVSAVTLQCVPAFRLHAVEEPMRIDAVLADIDSYVDGNDHFELFWVPNTGWCFTKRNNRTDEPVGGRSGWETFRDKVLYDNVAFGMMCRLGRIRPAWIPRLAKAVPSSGRVEYVEHSYKVFASPRHVRFYEMEYAIPRAAAVEALQRVRAWVAASGLQLSFPVEVRFSAGDDIPLSIASGRDSCYIAVHVYRGTQFHQYFSAVERIMDDYEGRPHWGKLHFQRAETLAPRYPEWDRFQAVRRRLDPEGRFANDYTDRVLGPVA